jgi:hypothetical protein
MFAAITALFASIPAVVHACPMCFAGAKENTDAFIYGSLFLMIVPTATLGSLGYWAYRRIKAIDDGVVLPDSDEVAVDQQPQTSGNAVILQMPPRQ